MKVGKVLVLSIRVNSNETFLSVYHLRFRIEEGEEGLAKCDDTADTSY